MSPSCQRLTVLALQFHGKWGAKPQGFATISLTSMTCRLVVVLLFPAIPESWRASSWDGLVLKGGTAFLWLDETWSEGCETARFLRIAPDAPVAIPNKQPRTSKRLLRTKGAFQPNTRPSRTLSTVLNASEKVSRTSRPMRKGTSALTASTWMAINDWSWVGSRIGKRPRDFWHLGMQKVSISLTGATPKRKCMMSKALTEPLFPCISTHCVHACTYHFVLVFTLLQWVGADAVKTTC